MRTVARRRLPGGEARDGWTLLAAGAVVALAFTGCRGRAAGECARLVEARDHEAAARLCGQAFERSRDTRWGVEAARAEASLGRDEAVLAWTERLRGTGGEAPVLSVRAAVYRKRGDKARARADLERQHHLYRQASDARGAGRSAYRLYYDAWEASDHRRAIEWAAAALADASSAQDSETALSAVEALFTSLREVGDLQAARRALEDALARTPQQDRARRARLLTGEGLVRLDEGRPALARDAFRRALDLMDPAADRRYFRAIHLNAVHAGLALGDLDGSARDLEQAWRFAEPGGSNRTALLYYSGRLERLAGRPRAALDKLGEALGADAPAEWVWQLELEAGRAREALGDARGADEAYARSAASIEAMRAALGVDDLKASLLARKREPYEALVRLRAAGGRPAQALEAAERASARTFLDAAVHAARGREAAAASGLADAAARLQALQGLLPALAESPVAGTRPVGALLQAVGDSHVRVYFSAGDQLWLLLVSGGRVQARRLTAPGPAVAERVAALVERPDDGGAARALGTLLMPQGTLPPVGSRMVVIADGALARVPFAALEVSGRRLVMDYVVTRAPSVNAWAVLRGRRTDASGPLVVMGDPHGDLPAARLEAGEVAGLLGVAPHLGATATRERLGAASGARVLHLATHTTWTAGGPRVRMADGEVTAEAIVRDRVAPRLVVVATCASAVPPGEHAWGSLALAFLAAGSPSVVASLWSIEDEAARRMMARFYAEGPDDPAAALARAQRWAAAQGWPASVWAPFVVFGSGEGPAQAHHARSR